MTRLIAVLVLGALVAGIAGCCDCDKNAGETWGPGLMHWSSPGTATKPTGISATMPH